MKVILRCALVVLAGQLAVAADPAHHHHTVSRSAPGPHHTKASSFAPTGHSTTHVYGSPIQAPILHRRTPPKKKPAPATASASATQPGK